MVHALDIVRIRIYSEGRIEKSVSRIAIWHHEACRVMTNGDPHEVRKGVIILSKSFSTFLIHTFTFSL